MKIFSILFKAEFKRFWTPAMIVTAIGIIGIGDMITFGLGTMKQLPKASIVVEMSYGIVSFFAILIFSAGIIGADVKSGWLRTLLIRSVSRQHYVLSKVSVVITATLLTLLLTIFLPIVYFTAIAETKIVFDTSAMASILLLKCSEIILFIIISTCMSCWISGAFNSLAVYIWFGASQMIEMLISQKYWDIPWLMVLKDFLSPTGFQNAQNYIKMGLGIPVSDILWGIASITFFTALTLFSINKIQVDAESE